MDQWQGCLAPGCQLALGQAYETVLNRGGSIVTPEDLLLALLDVDGDLIPFLVRWGVDIDELVRTVQCEQSLSPRPGSEAGLSASLIDWLASARECYDEPWLNTCHLLSVLVLAAERFQDKAYVAVLEAVPASAWEALSQSSLLPPRVKAPRSQDEQVREMPVDGAAFPLSSSSYDLAVNIAARVTGSRSGVLWLQCPSSIRTEAFIAQVRRMAQSVAQMEAERDQRMRRSWYRVEWAAAGDDSQALERLFRDMERQCAINRAGVFLFEGCSPAVFVLLVQGVGILKWRRLLTVAKPLVVLASPEAKSEGTSEAWLEVTLALKLSRFPVPLLSADECLRFLRFRQTGMERQWGIEIADEALEAAVASARKPGPSDSGRRAGRPDTDPGVALELLREALDTKLTVRANGSGAVVELRATLEDLERRRLLAQARGNNLQELTQALDKVCLDLAAEEAHWHGQAELGVLVARDVTDQVGVGGDIMEPVGSDP